MSFNCQEQIEEIVNEYIHDSRNFPKNALYENSDIFRCTDERSVALYNTICETFDTRLKNEAFPTDMFISSVYQNKKYRRNYTKKRQNDIFKPWKIDHQCKTMFYALHENTFLLDIKYQYCYETGLYELVVFEEMNSNEAEYQFPINLEYIQNNCAELFNVWFDIPRMHPNGKTSLLPRDRMAIFQAYCSRQYNIQAMFFSESKLKKSFMGRLPLEQITEIRKHYIGLNEPIFMS